MRSLHQLLRQPLKTLAGVILITLSVAILCVCMGQAMAAVSTAQTMDYQFSTVALPTSKYQITENDDHSMTIASIRMPQEILDWIDELAVEYPDIIKAVSRPGLASAYIPQLTPDNMTAHPYHMYLSDGTPEHSVYSRLKTDPAGAPYSSALLEVTLTQISDLSEDQISFLKEDVPRKWATVEDIENYLNHYNTAEKVYATQGYSVELTATVDRVVALQEGYRDPSGMTLRMTLEMSDPTDWDDLELSVGDRCLVYGMDYTDEDWELHYSVPDFNHRGTEFVWIDEFDTANVTYLTDSQLAALKISHPGSDCVAIYRDPHQGITVYLNEKQISQIDAVSLTLDDPCYPLTYEAIYDDDLILQEIVCTSHWSYVDTDGQTHDLTIEEYYDRYRIPTIVELGTGQTAEEFLASEGGAHWQAALERTAVNNQSFPVLTVDKLGYIADFAKEKARVTQGRDFTQEELDTGANVCLISESLAQANGLSVGDVITPRFYAADESLPYQTSLAQGGGIIEPAGAFYFTTTAWATEAQEYIIVGLYRQDAPWSNTLENPYQFTPNTIFVPANAVTAPVQRGDQLLFLTVVLHNGKLEDFMKLVSASPYSELFVCYDQGYSTIAGSLHDYQSVTRLAATVGLLIYGILLLLFLFLFPGRQDGALFTMNSFGATARQKLRHIITGSVGILLPGTIFGLLFSVGLWNQVTASLLNSKTAAVDPSALQIRMEPAALAAIALLQLVLALLLTILMALPMIRRSRRMKKK